MQTFNAVNAAHYAGRAASLLAGLGWREVDRRAIATDLRYARIWSPEIARSVWLAASASTRRSVASARRTDRLCLAAVAHVVTGHDFSDPSFLEG